MNEMMTLGMDHIHRSQNEKILILGAGIYQEPLINEAKKRGYYTIVASVGGNYPGFKLADKYYYIDTTDKERILDLAINEKIDSIATTGTDVAIISIGYVCSNLGLKGISYEAARLLTDKALMKKAFVEGGVKTAPFYRVSSLEEIKEAADRIGYPVILKIVDKSGSRGISKISCGEQIAKAYEYACHETNSDHMVLEKFIDGKEIGVDALVQNGRIKLVLPHGKYVYQSGRTGIPIGHYCPMPCSKRVFNNIVTETEKIIKVIKLDNCCINIDAFVLSNEDVLIIEAAGRCGATGIPEVITKYTGVNYYGCILDNALGLPIKDFAKEQLYGHPSASILIFSKESGLLDSICYSYNEHYYQNEDVFLPNVLDVKLDVKYGDKINVFRNGTDRIGMAVISADTYDHLQEDVTCFRNSLKIKICK